MMSWIEPMAITALGACTPLGDLRTAAAAVRTGLSRATAISGWTSIDETTMDSAPVIGCAVSGLTDGFEGIGRLTRMALAAAEDLAGAAPWLTPRRTACFLVLPPLSELVVATPTEGGRPAAELLQRAAALIESALGLDAGAVHWVLQGKEGLLPALLEAHDALRRGRCDYAVVGACDSLLDPGRREALLDSGRVKTRSNPVGFIPGEAAALMLLERAAAVSARGGAPEALLGYACSDVDESAAAGGTPMGAASERVIAGTLQHLGAQHGTPLTVYPDLNGEQPRAADWGCALVRLAARYPLNGWVHEVPAQSVGDTGAAAPFLAMAFASRALRRGYAAGEISLVLAACEGGHRSAFSLRTSNVTRV
jgi:3-oxoacyl-[acyl-carrier-protein] synthase-1